MFLGFFGKVIVKLTVRVSNTHLLDSLRDAVKHAEFVELLVSLALSSDVGAVYAEKHIDFQEQPIGVRVNEVTSYRLVQVEQA